VFWCGLCRSLKTGGVELAREKWDEAAEEKMLEEDMQMAEHEHHEAEQVRAQIAARIVRSVLPDWTRVPLPAGAPPAARAPPMAAEAVGA